MESNTISQPRYTLRLFSSRPAVRGGDGRQHMFVSWPQHRRELEQCQLQERAARSRQYCACRHAQAACVSSAWHAPRCPSCAAPAAAAQRARTLGAALVKLRRRLVEQRVHGEGQVELLDVQRLQGGLQGGLRVELVGAPPPAPALLVIAAHATIAQLAGCSRAGAGWGAKVEHSREVAVKDASAAAHQKGRVG